MKQYLLYICAAALLASCSKNSDMPGVDVPDGKMAFAANIPVKEDDWSRASARGTVTDNTNISGFGAFGFHTGSSLWNDVAISITPNKMFNVHVTRVGNTLNWTYNPPVQWLGGDDSHFTFFGYSPRATDLYQDSNNPQGNNIQLKTTTTTAGVPAINYSTLDYVPMQVDLLLAKPVYNTPPVDKVVMQFAHALSQIRFKGWSAQQGSAVNSIAINGIRYKGTVPINGEQIAWTTEADTKNFVLSNFPSVSIDEANMTDLTANGNAFMILPQDLANNNTAQIVITATVGGKEKVLRHTIKENWEPKKSYTYTIALGGTTTSEIIIIKVDITDWVVDSEENLSTGTTTP